MVEYQRIQFEEVRQRVAEPRTFLQVIVGPRQVGKSTLMDQVLAVSSIPYFLVTADGVEKNDSDWISRMWNNARVQIRLNKYTEALLVIDEVQKLEQWSEVVKKEWDADTRNGVPLKVFLLGSSRLLLRKGLTESLAGRFEMIHMGHWTYQEMRDAFGFTLDEWIYYGGYPGAARFKDDMPRWRKYIKDSLIAPAIEKDVIMTSNIYKPALMRQLFDLGCSYSAELLSLTKVVGQLQDAGNVTTLSSYLAILNQCNLLAGIQKYANDEARKYLSIPKFQVYNNALLTAYKGATYEKDRISCDIWGRWVESAVGAYLLGRAEEGGYRLFYWRERDAEVDFILCNQGETIAIEVKSGRRKMNKGIPLFEKQFQPKYALVVGNGGISLDDFFTMKIEDLF